MKTILRHFCQDLQANTAAISAHGSSGSSLIIWKMHTRAGVDLQVQEEKANHLLLLNMGSGSILPRPS